MSILENSRLMYAIVRHSTVGAFAVALVMLVRLDSFYVVDWQACSAYIILATLCEVFSIRMRTLSPISGEFSLGYAIVWAGMVVWGPLAAVAIAASSVVLSSLIGWVSCHAYFRLTAAINSRESEPVWLETHLAGALYTLASTWIERRDYPLMWVSQLSLYNTCLSGLISVFVGLSYLGSGGVVISQGADPISFRNFAVPFCVSMAVHYMLDLVSHAITCAIWEPGNTYKKSIGDFVLCCRMWMRRYLWANIPGTVMLGPAALILAYLQSQVGAICLVAVITPFYAMRYAFGLTMDQIAMYRDTITTLGTYMQHYHPYTRGHLRRVAELSERVARELKLPADVIMLMPDAGMLHDIGKVGVSEEILDKITKLTDEEWEQIKSHPVKGAEIVSHLDFLDRIVPWVKYHHKWHNGTGYPDDGLKDIPIEAAIIAVADAFDAMTDDRELSLEWTCDTCGYKPEDNSRPHACPKCGAEKYRRYRQPMSMDQAINELRRGAGTQFHPDVVHAFLKVMLDDRMEKERIMLDQAA